MPLDNIPKPLLSIPVPQLQNKFGPVEIVERKRSKTDPRPMFFNSNVVKSSNGSSYVEAGNTKILVTVHGPSNLKSNELGGQEKSTRGTLEITLRFASFAREIRFSRKEYSNPKRQESTEEEAKLSKLLQDTFSPAICLDRYPRSMIEIFITVLEDDGGVLSTAVLATSLALADGGIELYDLVLAISLHIGDDGVTVDPDATECSQYKSKGSSLVYGIMPSLNQVCLTNQQGTVASAKQLSAAISLGTEICYKFYPLLQEAVSQSFNKANVIKGE